MVRKAIIKVSDTTLRDASHSPGIFFSRSDKIRIAKLLDMMGIDEIEAGIPTYSKEEFDTIKEINSLRLRAKISPLIFCRMRMQIKCDIDRCVETGCKSLCISIPVSDEFMRLKLKKQRDSTKKMMVEAVSYAKSKGLYVVFTGEDAPRADMTFLMDYVRAGEKAGADRFRFSESVACIDPTMVKEKISKLISVVNIPLEIHCHTAYGLGVANSLAAIEEGVSWISATVNGLGERGGNTPLAEILLCLRKFYGQNQYNLEHIKELSDFVALKSDSPVNPFAPIVGSRAFDYEIGMQYQNNGAYEDFNPELVGNKRSLVIGDRADKTGIRILLEGLGIVADNHQLDLIKEKIKAKIESERKIIDNEQLRLIAMEVTK